MQLYATLEESIAFLKRIHDPACRDEFLTAFWTSVGNLPNDMQVKLALQAFDEGLWYQSSGVDGDRKCLPAAMKVLHALYSNLVAQGWLKPGAATPEEKTE